MKERIDKVWGKGRGLVDQDDIKDAFLIYYQKLFSCEGNLPNNQKSKHICKVLIPKKVYEEEASILKRLIALDEILKAIRMLNNNKAPRPDRLPIEFYKEAKN